MPVLTSIATAGSTHTNSLHSEDQKIACSTFPLLDLFLASHTVYPSFLLLLFSLLLLSWHRARLRGTKQSKIILVNQGHTEKGQNSIVLAINILGWIKNIVPLAQQSAPQMDRERIIGWHTQTDTQHCKRNVIKSSDEIQRKKCCRGQLSIFLTHIRVSCFSRWPNYVCSSVGF